MSDNNKRIHDTEKKSFTSQVKGTFEEYFSDTSSLDMSDDDRKKLFRKLTLIIISMFLLALCGGLIRFDGVIHNTFIIIVYVLEILMMMALANGLFTLTTHYNSMIEKEMKKSVDAFPSYTVVLIVFCAISFIASIVYVIVNGFHKDILYFVVYLLIKIAIAVLSYYFRYLTLNLEFKDKEE